jgi:hypothetical protein
VGVGGRGRQLDRGHAGARLSVGGICARARSGLGYYKYIYYASWCRFDELVAGVALALLKNGIRPPGRA